jgi:hypothetical protein
MEGQTNIRKTEDKERESLFSDSSRSSESSRNSSPSIDRSESKNRRNESEEKKFIMKNGCCRECMRAFSKTGKSCLCQVPRHERKYTLPDKGCNFCGCSGILFILRKAAIQLM